METKPFVYVPRLIYKVARSLLPEESPKDLIMSLRRESREENRYPVTSTIYINTLSFPVIVVESSGKRFKVPPKKHNKYRGVFVIRQNLATELSDHHEMVKWMTEQAEAVENKANLAKETKLNPNFYFPFYTLAKNFGTSLRPNTGWGNANIWSSYFEDYTVAYESDFGDKLINGSPVEAREIYHTPTGVMISNKSLRTAGLNPNDPLYSSSERIERLEEEGRIVGRDVAVRFELISNRNNYTPRYVKLGKKIEKILPKTTLEDPRPDGLYVTRLFRNEFDASLVEVKSEYCPLSEASERYGVYTSYDEAETDDFVDKKLLARLRELENKLITQERERDLEQYKHNKKEEDSEKKIRSLQDNIEMLSEAKRSLEKAFLSAQQDRDSEANRRRYAEEERERAREAERNSRKHEDEKRSHDRKDTSEVIKFISTVVITIVGLCAFLIKKK